MPDQYNEIMNVLYAREMRTYLPIQELNVLLEPIQNPSEISRDDEDRDQTGEEELDEDMDISDQEEKSGSVDEDKESDEDEEGASENESVITDHDEDISADEQVGLDDLL